MEIKKGREKAWNKYLKINLASSLRDEKQHPLNRINGELNMKWDAMWYNLCVVAASEAVGCQLTLGKSPKVAEKAMEPFGLSMMQAGMIANTVVSFHPRGAEFRDYWNGQFGSKSKKGVVNPSVLVFRGKSKWKPTAEQFQKNCS